MCDPGPELEYAAVDPGTTLVAAGPPLAGTQRLAMALLAAPSVASSGESEGPTAVFLSTPALGTSMPVDSDEELREILDLDTIAVVGCSATPGKAAHDVPKYLLDHGYDVVPVNPYADEIFGREAYDSLTDVPGDIDVVDVFRPSDEVAGVVEETLDREDAGVIWTQLGIRDDEAAARAEDAGRRVVQDKCIKVEHQRLLG